MNSSTWIKNALATQANASEFKSVHGDLPFEVVDECLCVDFYTKADEIPIIIHDESGLQIFAICTLAQKVQILSKIESVTASLERLHLRCLQYKLDSREAIRKMGKCIKPDDICSPGVDYQIVLILMEIEQIGTHEPLSQDKKKILKLKLWYYDCHECKIFASTIKANLMTSAAKENNTTPQKLLDTISNDKHEDQQNVLPIIIPDSQEPYWVNSSIMTNSQYTQETSQWPVHDQIIPKEMNVQPPCCSTKMSVEMENSRLNELVNPSTLNEELSTHFLFEQAPGEHSSPEIVMEEELLNTIQSNSSAINEIQDDMHPMQGLSSTENLNDKSSLVADLTLTADSCASLMLATSMDINLSPMTVRDDDINRPTINQDYETPEVVSTNHLEQAHLDNSRARVMNTNLDKAESTEVINFSDTKLDEINNSNVKLDLPEAHISSKYPNCSKLLPEKLKECETDHDMDTNMNLANRSVNPSHSSTSKANLDQQNLEYHDGHQINSDLTKTDCTVHTRFVSVLPNLRDGCEKSPNDVQQSGLLLDPTSHENLSDQVLHGSLVDQESPGCLLGQPSVRQPPDQSSHRRKKRKIKSCQVTVMYPIPDLSNLQTFDNFRCSHSFFIKPSTGNESDDSSSEESENRIPRQSPAQTHTVIRHATTNISSPAVLQNYKSMNRPFSPSHKQNQNKCNIDLAISNDFRNGLMQHLTCSESDSDSRETTTKALHTSVYTRKASRPTHKKRYTLKTQRRPPNHPQISSELRNGLLKHIFEDL